jgi:hypothetical protein
MHQFSRHWEIWSKKHPARTQAKRTKFNKWVDLCENFEKMDPKGIVHAFRDMGIEESADGDEEHIAIVYEDDELDADDTLMRESAAKLHAAAKPVANQAAGGGGWLDMIAPTAALASASTLFGGAQATPPAGQRQGQQQQQTAIYPGQQQQGWFGAW